jgi:hypothetical protein
MATNKLVGNTSFKLLTLVIKVLINKLPNMGLNTPMGYVSHSFVYDKKKAKSTVSPWLLIEAEFNFQEQYPPRRRCQECSLPPNHCPGHESKESDQCAEQNSSGSWSACTFYRACDYCLNKGNRDQCEGKPCAKCVADSQGCEWTCVQCINGKKIDCDGKNPCNNCTTAGT